MKLLGVRKSAMRYQTDPRAHKRRLYGSMSSLPSSVSSRPIRDRHRRPEDRKKFVRDIKVSRSLNGLCILNLNNTNMKFFRELIKDSKG